MPYPAMMFTSDELLDLHEGCTGAGVEGWGGAVREDWGGGGGCGEVGQGTVREVWGGCGQS